MVEASNERNGTGGRIVVGVDGSDTSIEALGWACHQAELTGSPVEAVTTWQWPVGLGASGPFPTGYDPEGDARTLLGDIIEPVAAAHPSVTMTTLVVEGHPAEALVEASRHAGLLVVGSRGHGSFTGMLLGSVSQHCAAHAATPVVIYRQPGRET